jgi:hypothetical protein
MRRYINILSIVTTLLSGLIACGGGDSSSNAVDSPSTIRGYAWNTARRIDQSDGAQPLMPRICADQAGNAVAIWYVSGSGVFSTRFDASNGWSDQALVDSSFPPDFGNLSVASDREGNTFAIWGPERGQAAVARYEPGEGWRPTERIAVDYDDWLDEIHVGLDRNGNGFAFFSTWHPFAAEHYYFRYSRESGWGERHSISVNTSITRYGLDLFVAPNGYGTVAIGSLPCSCIYFYRLIPDSTNILFHQIDGADESPVPKPQVAGDTQDNLFVVWRSQAATIDGTAYAAIQASHYLEGSGWEPEASLSTTARYDYRNLPKIAADELGNAIGVWEDYDGTYSRVQACRYTADTGWTSKTNLGNVSDGDETAPEIVVDPYGNAVAAWIQDSGGGLKIYASRFLVSDGWTAARSIDVDDAGDSSDLSLAVNNSGQVFAVWARTDGTNDSIYANRLD